MTNTTAKAQLLDLLIEPLKGCKGLYAHRQNLICACPIWKYAITSFGSRPAISQAPESSSPKASILKEC